MDEENDQFYEEEDDELLDETSDVTN